MLTSAHVRTLYKLKKHRDRNIGETQTFSAMDGALGYSDDHETDAAATSGEAAFRRTASATWTSAAFQPAVGQRSTRRLDAGSAFADHTDENFTNRGVVSLEQTSVRLQLKHKFASTGGLYF